MKFVCVFAWADFHIHPSEKRFIEKLMDELELDKRSRNKVYGWLQHPPRPHLLFARCSRRSWKLTERLPLMRQCSAQ